MSMTVKELANYIGVSIKTIQRAIAEGRIVAQKKNNHWQIENPDQAKQQYLKNTNLAQARRKLKNKEAFDGAKEEPKGKGNTEKKMSLSEAELVEKTYKAKLAELKYNEQAGLLIPRSQVKKEGFELGRKVRNNILNVPGRLAHELASEVDPHKVEVRLMRELTQALQELTTKGDDNGIV